MTLKVYFKTYLEEIFCNTHCLLTGHSTLNWHLTLLKRSDALCPLCEEEHEAGMGTNASGIGSFIFISVHLVHVCFCSSTPSQRYASRGNAGEVVCSFPTTVEGSVLNNNWRESHEIPLAVKIYDEHTALVDPYKYMFQKTADKAYGEPCL